MKEREYCPMHWSLRLKMLTVADLITEHKRLESKIDELKKITEQSWRALKRYKRNAKLYRLRKKLRVP